MFTGRKVQYINIRNSASLNSSIIIKKKFAEINYILSLFENCTVDKTYIPVQYLYCTVIKSFFRILGTDDTIYLEQLSITQDQFELLFEKYKRNFIGIDATTCPSFSGNEYRSFERTWEELFDFFIPSLDFSKKTGKPVNILISPSSSEDTDYLFDLSAIFDLQFLFRPLNGNIDHYVLSVSGLGLVEFAEKLVGLFRPLPQKTIILYGFDKHYSESSLDRLSELNRSLALGREALFNKMLENAKLAGVTVINLESNEDLLDCFHKEKEGYLIQILTHYHYKNDSKKSRLLFKKSGIRFDILEKLVDEIKAGNEFRNDLVIDAVTCTNFFDFKTLYSMGFRYIYMSHHDFDTDQAAFVLNELYTGINAKNLGWHNCYMNGVNHFHEARSNVYRCFFSLSRMKKSILIP